ncbi:response regulator [Stieleria varia]|uniref:Chemotaxis protein CheY n=1 Tax=Stieleria varia TaxID=2528005 RepID=A0A5C6AE79_9BACT|nr:response regulator [Stieleria varia]TWT98352.1 Chemotaxis protein CheY [Stieleria varia]
MNPTILIVDDLAVEREIVARLIRSNSRFDVEFARDGNDAMNVLRDSRIDVIVTDLIMPGMDGMELTLAANDAYPSIPILLMTAYDTGHIAKEALTKGAASFVPKTQLNERLVGIVKRLVNRGIIDRCRNFAGKCLSEGYSCYELSNDLSMIEPVVNAIHRTMTSMEIANPSSRIRTCTAVEEAILNAIVHGNLEIGQSNFITVRDQGKITLHRTVDRRGRMLKFRDRKVIVKASFCREAAEISIQDSGDGFDVNAIVEANSSDHFHDGRSHGLALMHSLVGRVRFNDVANEVTLSTATVDF